MFLLSTNHNIDIVGIICVCIFALLIVVSSIIRYYRNRKYKIHNAFYKWVISKYGDEQIVKFFKAPDIAKEDSFVRYESIEMKYNDGNCRTLYELTFIEDPELKWIKKQKDGIPAKVFKQYVYFEIPVQDVSGINLTKAYRGRTIEMWARVIFGKSTKPIPADLISYMDEFKNTEEYANIKKQKGLR